MKKFLFLGIAATAMLASCTNDEVVEMNPQNAIGFESFVDKSTRATESDDITISNIKNVALYGWRTSGTTSEAIFTAKELTIAENGSASYSPIQYWAGGYDYNFEAIKGAEVTANQKGSTLSYNDNTAETDLVYAAANMPNVVAGKDPGKVKLVFNHLLSRVKFTFINGFESTAAAKITVTNVTLHNVYTNGSWTNNVWTNGTTSETLAFADNVNNVEPGNKQASTEHKYIIPNDGYKLTFELAVNQEGVITNYSHSVTTLPDVDMSQGFSYNFVATITPENVDPAGQLYPIEFTAEVNKWEDFKDTTTNLDTTTSGNQ